MSAVTAGLLDRDDVVELGSFRLKDVVALQSICQLGDEKHPVLRTVDSTAGNLPRQLKGLLGRQRELAELDALLSDNPLTTLVGPGGIGKTRLALDAARRAAPSMTHGAWLFELATISNPDDVSRVAADVLDVRESGGRGQAELVADHLRDRSALIVIDNCEHVIGGVADLADVVLPRCPNVRILATSREGLGVDGERLMTVGPLDPTSAATELFTERARSVDPSFDLERWRDQVEEVCGRLDGVPLAIELAAARVRSLTPDDLATRLDDRFKLLTAGRRATVERHRTLRETVSWSYDLLEPDEQRVFARLSVFAGVFDVAAAEAVASDDELDEFDVDDLLDALIDRSMVMTESGPFGRRFRLLETLRQYGAEQLIERGETENVAKRHSRWYSAEVDRLGQLLAGSDELAGVARLNELWDNVRAAHEWACEAADVELAASFLVATGMELYWRGRSELGAWAENVLAIPDATSIAVAVDCLGLAAGACRWAQDAERLRALEVQYGHLEPLHVAWNKAFLDGDWATYLDLGEPVAQTFSSENAYLAECTRFGSQLALLRLGRVDELDSRLDEFAAEANRAGQRTVESLCRQSQVMAANLRGDEEAAAARLAQATAIEVPPGTFNVLPVFGTVEVFDRGGQRTAVETLAEGIGQLIEANNMYPAYFYSSIFATVLAKLNRPTEVARAIGYFENATATATGLRSMVADGEALLATADPAVVAKEVERGAAMSHVEAMRWMADVLDELLTDDAGMADPPGY